MAFLQTINSRRLLHTVLHRRPGQFVSFQVFVPISKRSKYTSNGNLKRKQRGVSVKRQTQLPTSAEKPKFKKQTYNPRLIGFGISAATILVTAVIINNYDVVPISGRRRLVMPGTQSELRAGEIVYRELMDEFGGRLLPQNHRVSRWVTTVGNKIVQVSGLDHLKWEFYVVDHPMANCMVVPGGKVFLFGGMLRYLDSSDSLAAVLGHEIAHQVARHSAEQRAFNTLSRWFYPLLSLLFSIDARILSSASVIGVDLPFSRRCETEADYIGMILMARACFDPAAAVDIWEKMNKLEDQPNFKYFSTHPTHEDRAHLSRGWLKEARQERARFCGYQ